MSWRDEKAQHKAAIHAAFKIPAVYLPYAAGVAIPVNVRHHAAQVNVALPTFVTRDKPPEFEDLSPKLVIDATELPAAAPKGYVIFSNTEMYRIGTCGPVLYGYYVAECAEVAADACAALVTSIKAANGGVLPATYAGILS